MMMYIFRAFPETDCSDEDRVKNQEKKKHTDPGVTNIIVRVIWRYRLISLICRGRVNVDDHGSVGTIFLTDNHYLILSYYYYTVVAVVSAHVRNNFTSVVMIVIIYTPIIIIKTGMKVMTVVDPDTHTHTHIMYILL